MPAVGHDRLTQGMLPVVVGMHVAHPLQLLHSVYPFAQDDVEVEATSADLDPHGIAKQLSTGQHWLLAQAYFSVQVENQRLREDMAGVVAAMEAAVAASVDCDHHRRVLLDDVQRLLSKREEADDARRFAENELMSLRKHLDSSNGWTSARRPVRHCRVCSHVCVWVCAGVGEAVGEHQQRSCASLVTAVFSGTGLCRLRCHSGAAPSADHTLSG